MALNPTVRNYQMADGALLQKADDLRGCVTRDAGDFATRGIDAARISRLNSDRDVFSDFPTDEELEGLVTQAANAKDTTRHTLEVAIRPLRNMAEQQWGNRGGLYKTFGFDDLTNQTDNDLVRTGRRVVRVANTLLPQLASKGLTPDMIQNIKNLTTVFDTAIDAIAAAVEDRNIKTQQRITIGNTLFKNISELASTGKSLYEDKDEARYNDYVLNDAPPATPAASTQLSNS